MSWNYRVIRHDQENSTEIWYGIHTCFYINKEDEIPNSWSENPTTLTGSSSFELLDTLEKMKRAVTRKTLYIGNNELIEWDGSDGYSEHE